MGKIPKVNFNEGNPDVHFGQIRDILITQINQPLTSYDKAYIESRIDNSGDNDDDIRILTVIGDKPAPESTEIDISHKRKIRSPKTHTLNVRIDETNDQNYSFLQSLEQDGVVKVLMWYTTCDGKFYGGLSGIEASINFDDIIPESVDELQTFNGTLVWRGNHPDRIDNPLVSEDEYTDTIAPTAVLTPADAAVDIAPTVNPTIELSEAIRKVGGEILTDDNVADVITLVDSLAGAVPFTATILYNKKKIIIVPNADLAADSYTLTINGVEDYAGNALSGQPVSSTFTVVVP